jgi:hypothetical protein
VAIQTKAKSSAADAARWIATAFGLAMTNFFTPNSTHGNSNGFSIVMKSSYFSDVWSSSVHAS